MRVAAFVVFLAGCAGPIEVTHVVPAAEAGAYRGTKLHPTAIVRGTARAPLPPEANVDKTEVRIPQPGTFVYTLDPGETVDRDRNARVTAVRTPGKPEVVTKFVPGTTEFDGVAVKGELADHVQHVPLLATDRVELAGTVAPGDTLPNGGSVDTSRAWTALIFGAATLAVGWIPSIYVAASSNVGTDGWLAVPALGPWIALGARPECIPDPSTPIPTCLDDGTSRLALIADGILQTAGLGLLIFGLPSHTEVTWSSEKEAKLRIVPTFSATGTGFALRGTF